MGSKNVENCSLSNSEESRREIEYLQHQTTLAFIPSIVFLVVISVVGMAGNSLVLFVYFKRFKRSALRVFIMNLACYDLMCNVLVVPGSLIKFRKNGISNRYRKICRPFGKPITITQARISIVVILLLSLVLSAPYAILNGIQYKKTNKPGICGQGCRIDGEFIGTIWPVLNSGMFIATFVISSIVMVRLYALIRFKTRRLRCFNQTSTSLTTTADNSSDALLDGNSTSNMGNSFLTTTRADLVTTGYDVTASGKHEKLSPGVSFSKLKTKSRHKRSPVFPRTKSSYFDHIVRSVPNLASSNTVFGQGRINLSERRCDSEHHVNCILRVKVYDSSQSESNIHENERQTTETESQENERKATETETREKNRERKVSEMGTEIKDERQKRKLSSNRHAVILSRNSAFFVKTLRKIENNPTQETDFNTIEPETKRNYSHRKERDVTLDLNETDYYKTSTIYTTNTKGSKSQRTSCMLLTVILVFILSFLPFLALEFIRSMGQVSPIEVGWEKFALFHFFLRSYLLNTAANPIIYSALNLNFRKECLKIVSTMCNCIGSGKENKDNDLPLNTENYSAFVVKV
ncbi:uncharacterized protein LOC131955210 [Physella acuta]|uniref:uncharacterized protein LOC131955210 n=1 Tax=Physella acuta TaxID=109671 RepID=UPI0027DCF993|nr:uncharacterized protein LOC131955210 [Physella acuta]